MIINGLTIKTIADDSIENKKVIVRVDFDVSLDLSNQIADDTRMQKTLPTLEYLLKNNNVLILISKLGRPKNRDPKLSLKIVRDTLQTYLSSYDILLIDDFLSETGKQQIVNQQQNQIVLLENIRFYKEEKQNDQEFAKKLASLGNIFVMDAFAMCHREEASVTGIPRYLPHYAGFLLEKEINAISKVIHNPKKPVVAIIGGAKTSTKLPLLYKLTELTDYLLLGGGIANTFLQTQGTTIGKSLFEEGQEEEVKKILHHAEDKNTKIILPSDVICAPENIASSGTAYSIQNIPGDFASFDIGPETEIVFSEIIKIAQTVVWNGPVGFIENPAFRHGTDAIYDAIVKNHQAFSLVGGGDTLTAISKKNDLDKITHISTGGGAMLEFIEKGTLPGIEALSD